MAQISKQLHERPSDDIDPKKKLEKDWHLKAGKHIWSYYQNDKTAWPFSGLEQDRESRLYAKGEQGTDRYQKKFDSLNIHKNKHPGTTEMQRKRKNYMNIDYTRVMTIAPKIMHVIMGRLMTQDKSVSARAIDPLSSAERMDMKFLQEFEMLNKKFIEEFSQAAGIERPKRTYVPKDKVQLDIYAKLGGYKLATEVAVQNITKLIMRQSRWSPMLKKRILLDLVQVEKAATRDYLDPVSKKVKVEYLDVLDVVIEASSQADFRDSTWAGHVSKMSILDVRRMTDLTMKEIMRLASSVSNNYVTDWKSRSKRYASLDENGAMACDSWKVDVLNYEIMSVDSSFYEKRTVQDEMVESPVRIFEKDYSKGKTKAREGVVTDVSEYLENTEKRVYKGIWIINTDHVMDFGLQHDVVYEDDEPRLSYNVIKLDVMALNKVLIPFYDQLALAFYKLQDNIIKLQSSGIAVEWNSLTGMSMENADVSPMDILSIRDQRNVLVYRSETPSGPMQRQGAPMPIQKIPGNTEILNEVIGLMDFFVRYISVLSGVDSFSATSAGGQGITATETNAAMQSTSDVLNSIYLNYIDLQERQAESVAFRLQMLAHFHPDTFKDYLMAIGTVPSKILKLSEGIRNCKIGIFMEVRPSEQDKMMILDRAAQGMAGGKDGTRALKPSDFFMIQRLVQEDEMQQAWAYLTDREDAYEQKANEHAEKMMMKQSEAQAQADSVMKQNEMAADDNRSKNKKEEIFVQAISNILETKAEREGSIDQVLSQLNNEKMKYLAANQQQAPQQQQAQGQPIMA